MHWSFLVLIGYIFFVHLGRGHGLWVAIQGAFFILMIFGCVVLHELGHALMARRFGIRTQDIVLLPIGGVARLERMPENPNHELLVALAGPAVNVAIAIALFLLITVLDGLGNTFRFHLVEGNIFARLFFVNIFLVVFNMLPAFPMDGGRVLRALLAKRMEYRRATELAASIGQVLAIVFGIVGFLLLNSPILILIAVFVFFGARAEARFGVMNSVIRGLKVRDAMIVHFRALSVDEPVREGIEELLHGSQHDFPVVQGDSVVGLVTRDDLLQAVHEGRQQTQLGEIARRNVTAVEDTVSLREAFERIKNQNVSTLPVVRSGRLVGILTLENISELIMVDSARRGRPRSPDVERPVG